jgi:lipopolysaccharide/colanic/teichoic acid biosynthesis glycosyltransferase
MNKKYRLELLKKVSGALSPRQCERKRLTWQQSIRLTNPIKRIFDLITGAIGLVLLSPLFALTALCIYLENPGSIFYSQTRVGKDGRLFRFFKFRSMIVDAEKMRADLAKDNQSEDGVIFKIKDDPRITNVGKFIRKFSIDELPQLFNVLQGNMSLVGPRPALPEEVVQYTLEQRKRLHALPGITCLWQVSGRSEIPFTGQVKLDVEYIKSTSLFTDISILLRTIPAVLAGKGAY